MAMSLIVGFAGAKGAGKTSAAQVLVNRGFVRWSFADPIREMLVVFLAAYGIAEAEARVLLSDPYYKESGIPGIGKTPRCLMQTLGTEWGRKFVGGYVWVGLFGKRWAANPGLVVVDDVRFDNEADFIRSSGGQVIHILRNGLTGLDGHDSESGIRVDGRDMVMDNDFGMERLQVLLNEWLDCIGVCGD